MALWDQPSPNASGGHFLWYTKMHIFEYVCKTCLKELGILLKCRETFEKVLGACNSSKNADHFFFQRFLKTVFYEHQLPNKKQKVPLCWVLWIQNKLRWLGKTSKTTFSKRVNSVKYPLQSYILVRTGNSLFMYFTGASH